MDRHIDSVLFENVFILCKGGGELFRCVYLMMRECFLRSLILEYYTVGWERGGEGSMS